MTDLFSSLPIRSPESWSPPMRSLKHTQTKSALKRKVEMKLLMSLPAVWRIPLRTDRSRVLSGDPTRRLTSCLPRWRKSLEASPVSAWSQRSRWRWDLNLARWCQNTGIPVFEHQSQAGWGRKAMTSDLKEEGDWRLLMILGLKEEGV